jgi:hypothetical protein
VRLRAGARARATERATLTRGGYRHCRFL